MEGNNKNDNQLNSKIGLTISEHLNENKTDKCETAILSDKYIDLLVEYDGNLKEINEEFKPQCIQIINDTFAILHISIGDMDPLTAYTFYSGAGLYLPSLNSPYGKSSMEASGILSFHTQPSVPLRGDGILIGIVDSGIDYTHRAFTFGDNTTKIRSIWDQTIQGNPPEGYVYGTEYTMEDINRALQAERPYEIVPSRDMSGHGTFLAGMAAGNEIKEENFVGAAPNAELVIVKLKEAKKI